MTQLTMQKERADLANAAKTRFLSAASHDLRQPLHALRLFIAQIKGNSIASEKRPVVQKIDASAQAINELIDNLLDISRLEAGSIKPVYSEFLINDILGRIENSFLAMAHQKQLTLRVVPSKLIVHSDIVLLERILANLVSNAVRYTDHGAILIGCRRRGDQLRIEVRDSGAGIAADQAAEIFLGFYKPKNSRAKGQNRTGLGLAIVERLCILLRHSISFESAIGQGSCFVVEIPLAQIVIKNTQIDPIHFSQQQLNELSP
ncbi:MAG: HAMP domain-containing sensor histidine kinase [Pseudomonadota bacterium]